MSGRGSSSRGRGARGGRGFSNNRGGSMGNRGRGRGGSFRGRGGSGSAAGREHSRGGHATPRVQFASKDNADAPIQSTSRICVKGLPKYVKEDRLRDLFSSQGQVTDVKIMTTKFGYSRQFAFIGYKTAEQAEKALRYFNKSFIDTSRIEVEFAQQRNSSALHRPWSRHSLGSSAYAEQHPEQFMTAGEPDAQIEASASGASGPESKILSLTEKKLQMVEKDERFREFVAAMRSRSSKDAHFWANDDDDGFAGLQRLRERFEAKEAKRTRKEERRKRREQSSDTKESTAKATVAEDTGTRHLMPASDDDSSEADEESDDEEDVVVPMEDAKDASKQLEDHSGDDDDSDDEEEAPADNDLDFLRQKSRDVDELLGVAKGDPSDSDEDSSDGPEEHMKAAKPMVKASSRELEPADSSSSSDEEGDGAAAGEKSGSGSDSEEEKDVSPDAVKSTEDPKSSVDASQVQPQSQASSQAAGLSSTRLFIRNLSYGTTEKELRELFEPFGELSEVHIPLDQNDKAKGFGFVAFASPASTLKALTSLDGYIFQGRLLHIIRAREKPLPKEELTLEGMDDDTRDDLTYKKKRELRMRQSAGKKQDTDSWNTLFMRSDTVADAISNKYGIEKSDLLDPEADNMAVRLALAETQLISETKEWLSSNGVQVSAFDGPKKECKRSDSLIIVKNLPFTTTEDDITRAFARFGSLGRVLLPPSRSMALVEFSEPSHARRAFRGLAYTKFKNVPMYLEWAPVGSLKAAARGQPSVVAGTATSSSAAHGVSETAKSTVRANLADGGDEEMGGTVDINETGTLFVKNLSFDTAEDTLQQVFGQVGPLRKVTITRKPNPRYKQGGRDAHKEMLSMGYGFVEFEQRGDALKALQQLQGAEVDGHTLVLKVSHVGDAKQKAIPGGEDKKDDAEAKSTKIIVKNVPFEASTGEMRKLFGTFGQLKRCRLPKKFDGGHRGFAFVEFVTKNEALNAVKALSATHLYGRHLVVEWAEEEQTIEEVRKRTMERYTADGPAKQKRKIMGEEFQQDEMEE